jgi:hypothetical protein
MPKERMDSAEPVQWQVQCVPIKMNLYKKTNRKQPIKDY